MPPENPGLDIWFDYLVGTVGHEERAELDRLLAGNEQCRGDLELVRKLRELGHGDFAGPSSASLRAAHRVPREHPPVDWNAQLVEEVAGSAPELAGIRRLNGWGRQSRTWWVGPFEVRVQVEQEGGSAHSLVGQVTLRPDLEDAYVLPLDFAEIEVEISSGPGERMRTHCDDLGHFTARLPHPPSHLRFDFDLAEVEFDLESR